MGKKILLADDSITIQKVIELTFSDEDFEVVTVGNGRLAIERVQDVRPDVVLCDIIMPEKDGYEVCDFIKRHPQLGHVPVLLLTGAFEPFDQERAARVGSDGFLAKPFEPQTLIAKVKDLLAQSGARRAPLTPSRPVAAAAAAAPTPPSVPPFEAPRPPAAPPAAEPGTSPAGVPSPFVRSAPPAPAPPAPPAPAASLGSEFEVFYPTPEEIEPLAASAEFEPVFAPSDFEGVEPPSEFDTVELPVVAAPAAAPEPPAAASWAPSFIPDEPFTDVPDEPFTAAAAPDYGPPAAVPAAAPDAGVADELFVTDESLVGAFAAPAPPSPPAPPPPARWSDPTLDVPFEERAQASVAAAYGVARTPPAFEESFEEEPTLTLDSDAAAAVPPLPVAAAAAAPDVLASDELFVSEPAPESTDTLAGVPGHHLGYDEALATEPAPGEREAAESGLFTALAEEEAVLEAAHAVPPEDEIVPELIEATFSETEPALTLEGVDIEPGALEPELEAEPEPLAADALFEDVEEPAAFEAQAVPAPAAEPVALVAEPGQTAEAAPPEVEAPVESVPEEVSFEDLAPAPAAEAAPAPPAAAVAVPVEMVEQIARRVVAQLGDKVIREVAWEVVPDLAEALIRREIDRLKAELDRLP
jgi:CheY-like chemotaxis protein